MASERFAVAAEPLAAQFVKVIQQLGLVFDPLAVAFDRLGTSLHVDQLGVREQALEMREAIPSLRSTTDIDIEVFILEIDYRRLHS